MIPGEKRRRINSYLSINHCGEVYGPTRPEDGEVFIGIPCGYYGKTMPFIEVRKGNRLVRTVNPLDLAQIEFADEEPTKPTA